MLIAEVEPDDPPPPPPEPPPPPPPHAQVSEFLVHLRNEYREMWDQRDRIENPTINALYEVRKRAIEATFKKLGVHLDVVTDSSQLVSEEVVDQLQSAADYEAKL